MEAARTSAMSDSNASSLCRVAAEMGWGSAIGTAAHPCSIPAGADYPHTTHTAGLEHPCLQPVWTHLS